MINEDITEALKSLDIPVVFCIKPKKQGECIVFNILETPSSFSDNNEDLTEYDVLLNLHLTPQTFMETTQKVKILMESAGFIKRQIPTSQFEEESMLINQPMHFLYFKESEINGKSDRD